MVQVDHARTRVRVCSPAPGVRLREIGKGARRVQRVKHDAHQKSVREGAVRLPQSCRREASAQGARGDVMAAQTIPGIAIIVLCLAGMGALPYGFRRLTGGDVEKVRVLRQRVA